jgi:hypothetical protein
VVPKEASVDCDSIQIQEDANGLNISFQLDANTSGQSNDSSGKRKEPIKMKPCSVRLERLQIATETDAPAAREEEIIEDVEEIKCEDAPSVPEEKILESNEEDDMVSGIFLTLKINFTDPLSVTGEVSVAQQ